MNIKIKRDNMASGKSLVIILIMITFKLSGQTTLFTLSYGDDLYTEGVASFQMADSSYLVVGNTGGNQSLACPLLLHIDPLGNIINVHKYERSYAVKLTAATMADGDLHVTGYAQQSSDYQVMYMKIGSDGQIKEEQYFQGSGWGFGRDLVVSPGDTVFICGDEATGTFGDTKGLLLCLGTQGNLLWRKTYGSAGYTSFQSIDTGFYQTLILAGSTTSASPVGDTSIYIINTQMDGNPVWHRSYSYSTYDVAHDIHQDKGGGYYLCGASRRWQDAQLESYLKRIDHLGNVLFMNPLGSQFYNDAFYKVLQLPDYTYLMTGYNEGTFSSGKKDFYVQNADASGNWSAQLGRLIIGSFEDEVSYDLLHTSDNGFLFTGTSRSYGPGISTLFLVKTDSLCGHVLYTGHMISTRGRLETARKTEFTVYPNPAEKILHISYVRSMPAGTSITLYDLQGRVLLQKTTNGHASEDQLNIQNLESGIYLLTIGHHSTKIVKR